MALAAVTSVLAVTGALCGLSLYPAIRSLGRYDAGGPTVAVTAFASNWDPTPGLAPGDANALLWTSVANKQLNPFRGFVDHAIYAIPKAGRLVSQVTKLKPVDSILLTKALPWVTGVKYLPPNTPGLSLNFRALLTLNGRFPTAPRFIIPSVGGSISIVDISKVPSNKVFSVSGDDGSGCEYYYTRLELKDLNNDGLLDIVTARYRDEGSCPPKKWAPPYTFVVELVAFLQPKTSPLDPWVTKVLYKFNNTADQGPTAQWKLLDLDAALHGTDDKPGLELVSAEFFGKGALAVYYLEKGTSWLDDNKVVKRVVVDKSIGGMFDVQVADLNLDGKAEIVATTHTVDASNGIYAYQPQTDFRQGPWQRRALATNFPVIGRKPDDKLRFRPAEFTVFHPSEKSRSAALKPLIALATDGGGQLVLLAPHSQAPSDWSYNTTVVDQDGCDVTAPMVADVNKDGYAEVFAPCLRKSVIFLSSFGEVDEDVE